MTTPKQDHNRATPHAPEGLDENKPTPPQVIPVIIVLALALIVATIAALPAIVAYLIK